MSAHTWGSTDVAGAGRARVRAGSVAQARQALTWALGGIWLLDAILQFQPYMYTQDFPNGTLLPAGEGSPAWISGPVSWSAHLMAHHLVILNTLFGLTQLAIAVGILLPRTRKPALIGSIVWALLVWWLGEGLGGMLTGPVSVLSGLPGAVILYALLAVLVWPRAASEGTSVATASPIGVLGAKLVWLALWGLFAVETLLPANRTPSGLHDMVAGMADGEPHWIASLDRAGANALADRGTQVSIVLAVLFALIAVSVFATAPVLRTALVIALALAALIWIFGQDFGGLATWQATDPNSAPLLALLAWCYWPRRAR